MNELGNIKRLFEGVYGYSFEEQRLQPQDDYYLDMVKEKNNKKERLEYLKAYGEELLGMFFTEKQLNSVDKVIIKLYQEKIDLKEAYKILN